MVEAGERDSTSSLFYLALDGQGSKTTARIAFFVTGGI